MTRRAAARGHVQFLRYLGVGLVNTLVGLGTTYLAKWLLGWGDVSANAIGYAVGICVSFSLNRRWTFDHGGPAWRTFGLFLLVALGAWGANLATVMLAIHVGVNSYLAQALGIPVYTITSFLANKYLVFTPGRRPEGTKEA